jgi:hypothetical protein
MATYLTIAGLADGIVSFTYGPDEPTHLELTVVDSKGAKRQVSFDAVALSQFAKMFGDLEKRFPGAFRGH